MYGIVKYFLLTEIQEQCLEYPSLIATEGLTEQLRPVGIVPFYHKHSVVTKATAKPVDLYYKKKQEVASCDSQALCGVEGAGR